MMKKIFSLMRIKSTYKKGTVFLWFLSVLGTLYFFVHKACCGGFILLFINSFVTWFHVMMNLGGRKKREECVFDFGSFKGLPSFILNIGSISSQDGYGNVCEKAECLFRCRFFMPLTTDSVFNEIKSFLEEKLEGEWLLEKGQSKAEPAMVENEDTFVRFIERSIGSVEGQQEFIHQYHGGSDIRFPILYGNSRCVGIGPYCELPKQGSGEKEWIDIDDYLKGIAILTTILLDYGKQDTDSI